MNRLTAKQEKFAQLVAVGGTTQSNAYEDAGYDVSNMTSKSVWEEASHLAHKVSTRIDELRSTVELAAVEELAWSKVDLVREAKTNLDLARLTKQIGSANGALELIGRVTGLLNEKQQAATVTVTRITVVTTDSVTELINSEYGNATELPGTVEDTREPIFSKEALLMVVEGEIEELES